MRFWKTHGRPASLAILPACTVTIRPAAAISVRGRSGGTEELSGFTIGGLIWGQESLWLTSTGQLAGLVSTDAEFDHFEAVACRIRRRAAALHPERREGKSGRDGGAGGRGEAGRGESGSPWWGRRSSMGWAALRWRILWCCWRAIGLWRQGRGRAFPIPRGTPVLDARGKWLLAGAVGHACAL